MNVNELTPVQTSAEFAKKAKAIALENSMDFALAWGQAKTEFPGLYEKAFGSDPKNLADFRYTPPERTPLSNAADFRAPKPSRPIITTTPLPSAENIAALCLPNDATYEEFQTALKANLGEVPLKPERKLSVFSALAGLNLFKKCGTGAEAEKLAAARFPKLAP